MSGPGAGEAVLALDLGTTMLKAVVFSLDGAVLAAASREQRLHLPGPGLFEQSPDEVWETAAAASREALRAAGAGTVRAVSVSNQRGTAIALNEHGEPVSNFVVWMDKRGAPLLERVADVLPAPDYYALAGHPLVSYTGISKVLWLAHEAPDRDRVRWIVPPQTWALLRLGAAEPVCDRSTGTFFFPLETGGRSWSAELAASLDLPLERLPALVGAVDVVGELAPDAAEALGLPPGIPLVAGGGDGQCAGAGSGALVPGRAMINIGTAAGVQVYLSEPVRDPGCVLNCAVHVVPGAWELEGHTQASGAALTWFRDRLAGPEVARGGYDAVVASAENVQPGADGLLFVPTFNGSSAPVVDLDARACLVGLTLGHGPEHVVRALLEGVALEIRWMLDAVRESGAAVDEIRLVGGAARSRLWSQIHADVLGHPVGAVAFADAAAVGAGMCAAVATGAYAGFHEAAESFVSVAGEFTPDRRAAPVYDRLYDVYRESFEALAGTSAFAELAALAAADGEGTGE